MEKQEIKVNASFNRFSERKKPAAFCGQAFALSG
jgi:hypothetical protein